MDHEEPLGFLWLSDVGWQIGVQMLLKVWPPEHADAFPYLYESTIQSASACRFDETAVCSAAGIAVAQMQAFSLHHVPDCQSLAIKYDALQADLKVIEI